LLPESHIRVPVAEFPYTPRSGAPSGAAYPEDRKVHLTMPRNTVLAGITALALGLSGIALAVPLSASADQPDFICEELDSGKINTVGDPSTVTVYAPPGYLIDGYCVKAATIKVFVPVVPPAATVVVDHPTVKPTGFSARATRSPMRAASLVSPSKPITGGATSTVA